MSRLPIVGVIGSGAAAPPAALVARALSLGALVARAGAHLCCGGGGGLMEAASRGFAGVEGRRGLVVGVLPGPDAPAGYPNPYVEIAIRTHLPLSGVRGTEPLSRNHVNVLSSDLVVALPGRAGTRSEVELALRYEKPLVAWLRVRDEIPGLPAAVRVTQEAEGVEAFVRERLAR